MLSDDRSDTGPRGDDPPVEAPAEPPFSPVPPVPPLAPFEHRLLVGAGLLVALVVLIVVVTSAGGDGPTDVSSSTTVPPRATTTTRSLSEAVPPTRPTEAPPEGTIADPDDPTVLVDRRRRLPEGYEPGDLVEAPVPFTFDHPDPKRLVRRTVAEATVDLFAAAAVDGLPLRAVSGFRSEAAQRDLHAAYVARDGEAAADRYSARPGHSEHQTGLAIDVTSLDGACPAEDCFGQRPEAAWLADHAHEHGFIIRYPAGSEDLTGYSYEPWHLRHVGIELATELHRHGLTLDEWYRTARRVP